MAQKTIVQLIDDLDGGEAAESISFGLDGVEYTIDLSEENAKKLRDAVADYIGPARRIGGGRRSANARAVGQANSGAALMRQNREQNSAIREWARAQGIKVSDRGRIPVDIALRFEAAHAGN